MLIPAMLTYMLVILIYAILTSYILILTMLIYLLYLYVCCICMSAILISNMLIPATLTPVSQSHNSAYSVHPHTRLSPL